MEGRREEKDERCDHDADLACKHAPLATPSVSDETGGPHDDCQSTDEEHGVGKLRENVGCVRLASRTKE